MLPLQIAPDIYDVGVQDWAVRDFHGYKTERGATYNSYLIMDEKITLIDTVKAPFAEELLSNISKVTPLESIDYIIINHVEPDHSGAMPALAKACRNAKFIISMAGKNEAIQHYGDIFNFEVVKDGATLNIGKRNLVFAMMTMLHWPDSMVTYCPEEEILFSNDGFGQHLATTERFADEVDFTEVMHQAKKYYANILMPYGMQAQKAVEALAGLKISMILTGHGVSWRTNIEDIVQAYQDWSSFKKSDKAVVVFDTMWHTTEIMAKNVADAFYHIGVKPVLFDLRTDHISDVMTELLDAKYIAVGSPTLNNNMMPSVAGFLCYMKGLAPKGLKGFAFGSYGWGGQSIGQVEEGLKECKVEICLPMQKIMNTPNPKVLKELQDAVMGLREA